MWIKTKKSQENDRDLYFWNRRQVQLTLKTPNPLCFWGSLDPTVTYQPGHASGHCNSTQPRNAKLICDFFIPNSYERQSDAPPHVRASPCAAAAWIDLKLCTTVICDFRQQIHAFAWQIHDGNTVFGPLGNFARIRRIWLVNDGLKVKEINNK